MMSHQSIRTTKSPESAYLVYIYIFRRREALLVPHTPHIHHLHTTYTPHKMSYIGATQVACMVRCETSCVKEKLSKFCGGSEGPKLSFLKKRRKIHRPKPRYVLSKSGCQCV